MDELDLVRLARPAVDDPSPDALAHMKAAVLDTPDAVPPGDSDAPDAPIELDVVDAPTPRRRRGLVLTSIAAAVLTVGGGIAIASRDRSPERTAGSADTSAPIDTTTASRPGAVDDSAKQVDGTWIIVGARIGGDDYTFDDTRFRLVLDSTTAGYSLTVCDVLVGTGIHVVGSLLQLDGSLTGVEAGCTDTATRELQNRLVAVLKELPTVQTDGDNLTLTNDQGTITMVRGQPVLNAPGPNPLDGRTFRITSLRDGDTDLPVESTNTIAFVDGRVDAAVSCNGVSATVRSVGTTLALDPLLPTLAGCGGDGSIREIAVQRLFGSQPSLEVNDGRLRLTGGGVTLTASEGPTPPPAAATPASGMRVPTVDELRGRTFVSEREGATITLSIDANGRASVTAGCNLYTFSFAIVDGYLEASNPSLTEKACPADVDKVEKDAANTLVMRPLVTIEGSTLTITNNPVVYVFTVRP